MTDDPSASPVWSLWIAVRKLFAVHGLLGSFGTPGGWSAVGVDHVSGLRRNRSTRETFELLAGQPASMIEALLALAELNVRRQRQMLTALVVAYVSFPAGVIAIWAEVSSDTMMQVVSANSDAVLQVLAVATAAVAYYAASHWRARQLLEVLELVRIERLAAIPAEKPAARRKSAA